jgi:hypothetical protein
MASKQVMIFMIAAAISWTRRNIGALKMVAAQH